MTKVQAELDETKIVLVSFEVELISKKTCVMLSFFSPSLPPNFITNSGWLL